MKGSETKQCQNCKSDFIIEPEDFKFYEKIKVPPPTWCPGCRSQRRMLARNIRNLYKRKCDAPGHDEEVISLYAKDKFLTIYCQKHWWSDDWNQMATGREYDFSKTFFEQFFELSQHAPLPNLNNINAVNSEYVSMTIDSKNCYLVFSATDNEDCSYSEGINNCRGSLDLIACRNLERSYYCVDCKGSFNIAFSEKSIGCSDSMFLYDCRNCTNCFGCWNLRNASYQIWNKQYSKDEYFKKIESFHLDSYESLQKIQKTYKEKLKKIIVKYADIINSPNCTGGNIENSRNCLSAFETIQTENSKYIWRFLEPNGADCYDITVGINPDLCYECCGIGAASKTKFAVAGVDSIESSYSNYCFSSSHHLFGCIGLRNKSYCILNKQYTKEEYEELVPKIIKHMDEMPYVDKKGRIYKYGEFFPPEIFPFGYNETIAQEYYPLTKEEAIESGYSWKDREERNYQIDINNKDIPDNINEVEKSIIGKVIECGHKGDCNEQCTEAFKIIKDELVFYKRMNIPLPRLCPNCRHYARLKQRNPLKLWHRKCMKEGCPNEFETSYSPDRPEIVYCEACYQREVY